MQAFEIPIQVRYAETDAMGVVHHSSYFIWLELARVEWLKSLGIDYKQMEQVKLLFTSQHKKIKKRRYNLPLLKIYKML